MLYFVLVLFALCSCRDIHSHASFHLNFIIFLKISPLLAGPKEMVSEWFYKLKKTKDLLNARQAFCYSPIPVIAAKKKGGGE